MANESTAGRSAKLAGARTVMLMIALAAASLTIVIMLGEGPVQAREPGEGLATETKADKPVLPGEKGAATSAQPCTGKPVRVVYSGYGEHGCGQKSAL